MRALHKTSSNLVRSFALVVKLSGCATSRFVVTNMHIIYRISCSWETMPCWNLKPRPKILSITKWSEIRDCDSLGKNLHFEHALLCMLLQFYTALGLFKTAHIETLSTTFSLHKNINLYTLPLMKFDIQFDSCPVPKLVGPGYRFFFFLNSQTKKLEIWHLAETTMIGMWKSSFISHFYE